MINLHYVMETLEDFIVKILIIQIIRLLLMKIIMK